MLVGLVSAKGSPGVTTTTLALASMWPRPALVVEADPFGGDIRAGLGVSKWPPDKGVAEVVIDLRTMDIEASLRQRAVRLHPYMPAVLAGLGQVGQAAGVPWGELGAGLARLLDVDVLADCGRFATADGVAPLLRECDLVVLVTDSSLRALRAAGRVAPLLQELVGVRPDDPRVSALVVAPGRPYAPSEVSQACRIPVLGTLPDDPRTAAVWSDGHEPAWSFARSPLQREARTLATQLNALGRTRNGVA